jgi:hypothetical protein
LITGSLNLSKPFKNKHTEIATKVQRGNVVKLYIISLEVSQKALLLGNNQKQFPLWLSYIQRNFGEKNMYPKSSADFKEFVFLKSPYLNNRFQQVAKIEQGSLRN